MVTRRTGTRSAQARNANKIQHTLGTSGQSLKSRKRPPRLRSFKVSGSQRLDASRRAAVSALKPDVLERLQMRADAIESVLHEVARRHLGENAPHHTLYGTFVEIACAIFPDVAEFRTQVIDTNLRVAIFVAVQEIECFHGIDSQGNAVMESIRLSDFKLKKSATPPKPPIASAFPSGAAFESALDKFCDDFAKLIDPESIAHRSDIKIGGSKYTDRTAALQLGDGREVYLLSEEYKARRSRGGEAQSAVRIDRIVGDPNVKPSTPVSGVIDNPTDLSTQIHGGNASGSWGTAPTVRSSVPAEKVRFNMAIFSQDQVLIKATSGERDASYVQVQRTKRYVKRKAVYGSKFRRGGGADEGLYRYLAEFPSRQIHALLRKLEAAGP